MLLIHRILIDIVDSIMKWLKSSMWILVGGFGGAAALWRRNTVLRTGVHNSSIVDLITGWLGGHRLHGRRIPERKGVVADVN